MSFQEKSQIQAPPDPESNNEWVTFESVRRTGEAGFIHSNNKYAEAEATMQMNQMPPGQDILNQRRKRMNPMNYDIAGSTDPSNCGSDPDNWVQGYALYDGPNNENVILRVDGNGFISRNNYSDRE